MTPRGREDEEREREMQKIGWQYEREIGKAKQGMMEEHKKVRKGNKKPIKNETDRRKTYTYTRV